MKRRFFRTAAAFVAAVLFAIPTAAALELSAASAILMDADTGAVLYEKNADCPSLIASTTKIMTAVVALEHCDPEESFAVPEAATQIEGSSIYLKAGETVTVRELLYGMMLHSGNDAAVALALACSGSVEEFVAQMNLKAQKLGLKNTHFENPNGLDGETHRSSARDLALLTQYALQNEDFLAIVSTKTIRIGERCFSNHNKLLWTLDGALGVKTGYTKAAGRVLVSAAERGGRRLIAVTVRDGNDWQDHRALYDFGFSFYKPREIVGRGECVGTLTAMDGSSADLRADSALEYAAADGETPQIQILYPRLAFSVGAAGSYAGWACVYMGTRCIGKLRLVWDGVNREAAG